MNTNGISPDIDWGSKLQRRILHEFDAATHSLSLAHRTPIDSVHDTRKRVKRIRAALRFFRGSGHKAIRLEDRILADAAKTLGPIRDGHVAYLRHPELVLPPPYSPRVAHIVLEANVALAGVAQRAQRWAIEGVDQAHIEHQVDVAYRSAWQRWHHALKSLDSDDFHRSRKSVKRIYYQLGILDDLGYFDRDYAKKGRTLVEHLMQLDELGELLGDHHDLTLLHSVDPEMQAKLEDEVITKGRCLFALGPKKHRHWIHALGPKKVVQ